MLNEFKKFAMRGNVVDMAVGIIMGAAFGTIVKSLVDDVLMPPIGILLGGVDFSNLFIVVKQGASPGPFATLADARAAGAVSVNYGMFLNTVVSFIIVAFSVFLLVRSLNAMQRQQEAGPATTRDCPFCSTAIPIKASRCPHCTSNVPAA